MIRLKTISESINEAMSAEYRRWRKNNVSYRGSKHSSPLEGINQYDGKFGKGLYTTPLSNKAMTKEYGTRFILVGAVPKKPLKFNNINSAEIWLQNYAINNGKGSDDIDKLRNFWKSTTIEDEVQKLGYDGIMIVGREMVLYNPGQHDIKFFRTEDELKDWYDQNVDGVNEAKYNPVRKPQPGEPLTYKLTGYHSTSKDNWSSIQAKGLIPGASGPAGQDWGGKYSGKGIYFHLQFPDHEVSDDLVTLETRIIVQPGYILPDEEAGTPDEAPDVIKAKGAVVVASRIAPNDIMTVHLMDTEENRSWAKDNVKRAEVEFHNINEAAGSTGKYPTIKWIKSELRNSIVKRINKPIMSAYIVGSEAKGTAKEGSDLDIALVIDPVRGKTALRFTEDYHDAFIGQEKFIPKWNGREVDFQFFYPDNKELETYSKIELR